ncbi:hypothetical protein [Methylomonas methanica]|uniref:Uncharacterized protein n=1 Tax=Methylomonas methanica (strain DSM 25384 / MC09) TaxID=857087 RepID=F9ZWJ2_METMM|nr:hypothetical protein [Methylomonas methanica]AEG00839.1 hypothetical protein Metme_2441 [Methylomonas methanica MC09]
MIRFKETLIRQTSDVIRWLDGTGREGQQSPVLSALQIELDSDLPVKGLSLLHKPGISIIWRSQLPDAEQLQRTEAPGRATETQMARPTETPYQLKGTVRDPSGTFNPRSFSKNCGNNSYPQIALYRSAAGTRLSQNKSLQGILRHQKQPGESIAMPASWALVTLQVNLSSTGDSFIFNAQADIDGYFQMPVTRLSVAMLSAGFAAELSVKADKAQTGTAFPDPDQMTAMRIALADSGVFSDTQTVLAENKNHRLKLGFVADETRVSTLELNSP